MWRGKHAVGTTAENFNILVLMQQEENHWAWHGLFDTSKPTSSDTPSPRLHLILLSLQMGTLSMQIYEPFGAILIQNTYIHYTFILGIRKWPGISEPPIPPLSFHVPLCQV